jgi:hypothetical protein
MVQACLLLPLLLGVVALLVKRLQVGFVPEQPLIATVRDLMVGNQLCCVAIDAATTALAGEPVSYEDSDPQFTPTLKLVPLSPGRTAVTVLALIAGPEDRWSSGHIPKAKSPQRMATGFPENYSRSEELHRLYVR